MKIFAKISLISQIKVELKILSSTFWGESFYDFDILPNGMLFVIKIVIVSQFPSDERGLFEPTPSFSMKS